MDRSFIMQKDRPVLEIDNYVCKILDYNFLPFSLRYKEVSFDDVMHGWTEARTMSIGKTNAKKILNGFRLKQTNPYIIAKLFHFASLSDCYWMKDESDPVTWKDINLFQNTFEKAVTSSALFGVNSTFENTRIHTPELTTQGMSAKAWVREPDGLYLYKVGKKELAASEILDLIQIPHVVYEKISSEQLFELADQLHIDKIKNAHEEVVKCKIISNEDFSILPWEDFQMYCSYHEQNEFDYIKQNDGVAYYSMQLADYILGNEDRHGANFGYYMNNQTGCLQHLYPLMDHDHAFSNDKDIPSQTSEMRESLQEAAKKAVSHVSLDLSRLIAAEKPKELSLEEWDGVVERARNL